MKIRPLTTDDLKAWWPGVELARSVRGFAAEDGGQVKGITGVMYLPTALVAFAEMGEDGQRYPLTIMRMARLMREMLRTLSAPVFAAADADYPNSEAFLERVGFERVAGRQFVFKKEGG